MRSEEKLKLKPDRMVCAEEFSMIVIILQTDFRKFAGIKCQGRRDADAFAAKNIARIERSVIAVRIFAPQARHPAGVETPEHLRIKSPIAQRFGWKRGGRVGPGIKYLVKPFCLP